MGPDLRHTITVAIEQGNLVRIIYHGGSRPGSIRDVRPLWLTPEALRATDVAEGIDKTFLLAKLELSNPGASVTVLGDDPKSVEEAIAPNIQELQALGWHVELTRDAARLHAYFKNGKPRKGCAVSLDFSEYTGVGVVDIDDVGNPVQYEETWKSRAPYHVFS